MFPLKESRCHSFSLSGLSFYQPFHTSRFPDCSMWGHPQHKATHTGALDKGLLKGSWLCTPRPLAHHPGRCSLLLIANPISLSVYTTNCGCLWPSHTPPPPFLQNAPLPTSITGWLYDPDPRCRLLAPTLTGILGLGKSIALIGKTLHWRCYPKGKPHVKRLKRGAL